MNIWSKHIAVLVCILSMTACSQHDTLTTSGGLSYEVLVTGHDYAAVHSMATALQDITLTALPQEEQAFDVSALVKPDLDQGTRFARNIILVSVDSSQLKQTRIRYEQDVYAHPQIIIHVDAPSKEKLRQDLPVCIKQIADALTRAEMNNAIINLREHHSAEATRIIEKAFGCRLWIPEDLRLARQGHDFLWFSNNSARGMQNICVYRYQADSLLRQQLLHKRDSIMGINLRGENDSAHMRTIHESVEFRVRHSQNITELGMRGLWEMDGDAMGGPFVSLALQRGDSILCIEGFVYAPEMRKRNLIRRMEATLYTLKIDN